MDSIYIHFVRGDIIYKIYIMKYQRNFHKAYINLVNIWKENTLMDAVIRDKNHQFSYTTYIHTYNTCMHSVI